LTIAVSLDELLLERRKEFAFEGHSRMDLLSNTKNQKEDNLAISARGSLKNILPVLAYKLTHKYDAIKIKILN
jgi:hypothetical protein